VTRLCEFYPSICLTTEEKARKNLSQGNENLRLRKTSVRLRKPSVRVSKTSFRLRKPSVRVQYTYYQNTHTYTFPSLMWLCPQLTTHNHLLLLLSICGAIPHSPTQTHSVAVNYLQGWMCVAYTANKTKNTSSISLDRIQRILNNGFHVLRLCVRS
jgi:hypothetical protein